MNPSWHGDVNQTEVNEYLDEAEVAPQELERFSRELSQDTYDDQERQAHILHEVYECTHALISTFHIARHLLRQVNLKRVVDV